MRDPTTLLRGIVDRQISVSQVVASRTVSSDQEAVDLIKLLSKTAVEMNLVSVVDELSRAQALGNSLLPDPLQNIPDVRPVLRPKVPLFSSAQSGSLRKKSRNTTQLQTYLSIQLTPANRRFRSILRFSVNILDNSSSPVVFFLMMSPPDRSCSRTQFTRRRLSVSSTKRKSSTNLGWETGALRVHISRGGCGTGTRNCRSGWRVKFQRSSRKNN
jgi:hypothetical protein